MGQICRSAGVGWVGCAVYIVVFVVSASCVQRDVRIQDRLHSCFPGISLASDRVVYPLTISPGKRTNSMGVMAFCAAIPAIVFTTRAAAPLLSPFCVPVAPEAARLSSKIANLNTTVAPLAFAPAGPGL